MVKYKQEQELPKNVKEALNRAMTDLGHWVCDIPIPENPFGIVYVITNIIDNKKYIGKKFLLYFT